MKWILGTVLLTLGGAIAWHFLGDIATQRGAALLRLPSAGAGASLDSGSQGVRKCLLDGRVVYTNESCPTGSREQALSGGSLSVLPAAPTAPSDAAAPAPVGNARDLLLKPDKPGEADIKARRIDAIINQ